jgi:large subunit ribosomal protein L29
MKMIDMRKMPIGELSNKEIALREELSKLSFQHKIRPLENSSRLSFLRKDIARIQTLKRQLIVR